MKSAQKPLNISKVYCFSRENHNNLLGYSMKYSKYKFIRKLMLNEISLVWIHPIRILFSTIH